ncbi:MAG: 3-oxoacyl-ACP reductase family protein [Paenibacillaceae bacterium]
MFELTGKTAVVTGGSRGLGLSIIKALAVAGADVAIVYPPFESFPKEAVANLETSGYRVRAYEADVTKRESVDSMVQKIIEDFGQIDIWVNNAGKMSETLLVDMDEEEWDDILNTDLRSVFLCCRAVVPHMISRKQGSIINIASQIAYKGGVRLTHYSAAKAGVIALTKSLAQEVAPYGINVNAVAPGPLMTDMTRPFATDDNWLHNKERSVALGRLGTTDEVAPTIVFLASSAASLYIGQTLLPNGGGVML